MARTPLFPRAGDIPSWALAITQRIERDYAQTGATIGSLSADLVTMQAAIDSISNTASVMSVLIHGSLSTAEAFVRGSLSSAEVLVHGSHSTAEAFVRGSLSSAEVLVHGSLSTAEALVRGSLSSAEVYLRGSISNTISVIAANLSNASGSLSTLSNIVRGGVVTHTHNIIDYGASQSTDCRAAILAAEAAAAPGDTIIFPPGTWYFSNTITVSRSAAAWIGAGPYQTKLVYNGAAGNNIDLIVFGTAAAQIINCHLANFRITSDLTMSAGTALTMYNFCRGTLDGIMVDGQDGTQKLNHGFWFHQVDHVVATNLQAYGGMRAGGSTGIIIDGGVGAVPKADLYISGLKIANFEQGIHVGGGFGGLFMDNFDVIVNKVNLLIDEAVAAEINREMMFGLGAFDTPTVGPNVDINASTSGLAWIQFCGTWMCTSPSAASLLIRNAGGHDINVTACRIYNNSLHAVEITEPLANVIISGNSINHNGGYGVNISVSAHHTRVGFNSFTSNVSGNIFDLGDAQSRAEALYIQAATVQAPYVGMDSAFYLAFSGANPYINFDANDFMLYDRAANIWYFVISGSTVGKVTVNGWSNGP